MREGTSKRREWVKNTAIIFLSVMLALTFFSNTIMNYSLPEVATAFVQSGSITAKVRGTGKVEATDPYKVVAKESRVISSVAVKAGDEVEKDDILYYLEDTDSEELIKAEAELASLKLEYMLAIFNGEITNNYINKVESDNTDSFSGYQSKVVGSQNSVTSAEDHVAALQADVDNLTRQLDLLKNSSTEDTTAEQAEVNKATQAVTDATNGAAMDDTRIANLESDKAAAAKLVSDLAAAGAGSDSADLNAAKTLAEQELARIKARVAIVVNDILRTYYIDPNAFTDLSEDAAVEEARMSNILEDENLVSISADQLLSALSSYSTVLASYNAAKVALENAEQAVDGAPGLQQSYNNALSRLATLENELARARDDKSKATDKINKAKNNLTSAEQILKAKQNNQYNANLQKEMNAKLIEANAALTAAKTQLENVQGDQEELITNLQAELTLDNKNDLIALKEAEIEKLKEKSMGTVIKAPVAGKVSSLAHVAGESTKPEEEVAMIQVAGKGYTVTFSVTNEQAGKVQPGDTGELQNAWYYQDTQIILTSIRPDPDKPGQNKLLTFTLTGGEIETGQNLNISVGQRSANYELTVPNSAIREDSNGKFILIVEPRNSPLGNRYFATRVDVEVLASDDNNTAISGALYGYGEYAITTATKPVTENKQVRFND